MDDMGTPGPNHPANKGLQKSNVVNMPMSKTTKARRLKNKVVDSAKNFLGLSPEQVTYSKPWPQPVAGALDDHIRAAQSTPEYTNMTRTDHFSEGQHEAKILSMRDHLIKKNMAAGDDSVIKLINMEDPTKD